jgi:hypothetical protein
VQTGHQHDARTIGSRFKNRQLTNVIAQPRHVVGCVPFVDRIRDAILEIEIPRLGERSRKVSVQQSKKNYSNLDQRVFEVIPFDHAKILDLLRAHLEDEPVDKWFRAVTGRMALGPTHVVRMVLSFKNEAGKR